MRERIRHVAALACVHGNREALIAVLADIEARRIPEVWSLGGMLGIGADPWACVTLLHKRCRVVAFGAQEVMLDDGETRDPALMASLALARRQLFDETVKAQGGRLPPLRPPPAQSGEAFRRWHWFQSLPAVPSVDGVTLAHGTPRTPLEKLPPPPRMNARVVTAFRNVSGLLLCGRSHIASIRSRRWRGSPSDRLGDVWRGEMGEASIIADVGAVGCGPRACYLELAWIVGGPVELRWHRVAYDQDTALARLRKVGHSEDHAEALAEQLRGRPE